MNQSNANKNSRLSADSKFSLYYREYDSFGNSHEIWKSDSWDLLYKLLRSKERRMKMMMIAARLYIYFPYGEISKNLLRTKNI